MRVIAPRRDLHPRRGLGVTQIRPRSVAQADPPRGARACALELFGSNIRGKRRADGAFARDSIAVPRRVSGQPHPHDGGIRRHFAYAQAGSLVGSRRQDLSTEQNSKHCPHNQDPFSLVLPQ